MDLKTARLTVLIDPATKEAFEAACREIDMTPSQVVRRMIREFMQARKPDRPRGRAAAVKRPK